MLLIYFLLQITICLSFYDNNSEVKEVEKFNITLKGGEVESQVIRDNGGKFLLSLFRGIEYGKLKEGSSKWSKSQLNYFPNLEDTRKFHKPCPNSENLNSELRCLFLDIYVPFNSSMLIKYEKIRNKLPVLVVFSTTKLNWKTTAMLSNKLSIIIVEVQYRNDILGFLSNNLGLEDQKTAINWIMEHLEFFGGDRSAITLFGSGLSAVCLSHLLNDKKNSLSESRMSQIHSAILIGGSYLHNFKLPSERDLIFEFKCSAPSLMNCIDKFPVAKLLSVSRKYNWYPASESTKNRVTRIQPRVSVPLMMGIEKLQMKISFQESIYSSFLSDKENYNSILRLGYDDCTYDSKQEMINDLFINSPVIRYLNALSANFIDNNDNNLYLFNNIGNYSISDLLFGNVGGLSDSDLKLKDYFLSAFKLFITERSV